MQLTAVVCRQSVLQEIHVIDCVGRTNNSGIMSESIPQRSKNKVCRRLIFDDDDAPEKQRNEDLDHLDQLVDLEKLNATEKSEQMSRWNFDFDNERPLDGDWQWERVSPPSPIQQQELIKTLEMEKEDKHNDRTV
ncbi:cyclin-dependent kinase inhibitor 1B [Dendroctonus ponderosae]|uniref:Cyclin-dependent kinase inhibitor domain-containing protein n=1 Tax=Dendroctonus ponderosae TaxID=77166 RepID=A0AAR5P1N3_DENPD|nr:cyclin-dependent kinase inhibitor 1B [Dendroctonus ponderosae]KAH0999500.1 hypothetical protein HUJ04_005275 [Dendroctonus ponderosae]